MATLPSTEPALAVVRAATGDERQVLKAFLDFLRAMVVRKAQGLSEQDVRRRHVPSATTLAGLVKHLTLVERNWFERVLAQDPAMAPPSEKDADGSFAVGDDDTVESLITAYEEACAASRRIAARFPLDHEVPHEQVGPISLRWIYVHMIEETARHAGHADILRELTDGATGSVV
ncbi:DinB family protein [Microbispora sp. NEAU-D428]|uniref:DinB family protein n=1 Tax=Microbispora sitophila TaxID=2771537 RepID=UPI001868D18C|nr:DinB family protein [Microbispora sitophila]MBE3007860.1 DinB family protein [Microbispora sitophila]